MATEHSLVGPLLVAAAQSAAPTFLGSFAATAFDVSLADYGLATFFSAIGIAGRHGWEAKNRGAFDGPALAFDLLTAPMLGIMVYLGCVYWGIELRIAPGLIIFLSLLGPSWFIDLGKQLVGVFVNRIGSGKP